MGARWFYILLANCVILVANIWLFVDKPTAKIPTAKIPAEIVSSPVVPKTTRTAVVNLEPPKYIAPLEYFNFPFHADFEDISEGISEETQIPLNLAEETILERDKQLSVEKQKSTLQSQKITDLTRKNNQLQAILSRYSFDIQKNRETIANQNVEITRLEKESLVKTNPVYKTDIDLVKKSIDAKPDLINVKQNELTKLSTIDEESFVETKRSDQFSGAVEFGYSYEQDNQVTKGIQGRLNLDYDEVDLYNINSDLEFEFENEDSITSTEKYRWQLQSDYNLDPVNLVFARSDLNRSKFSSYEQEDIFTVGYGRIFLNSEKHKFNIELGPGYRFAIPNDGEDAVSVDEFIIRTRLKYERVLSKSLQVTADAVLETGRENSVYNLSLKAQNRIYQELYLVFSFDYKYNQNVPVDNVNREVSSGLSLLYAF